jgi:NAD(P)H-dependent FMN reductase
VSTIVALCGSLRHGSFNRMLLRAAADMAPAGTTIVPESIGEIPLYDADVEEALGIVPAVQRLKDRIAYADGLLLVTPVYNNSVPGVLKNAIDWLSRPADDIPRVFRGRPVAIMGASIGAGGTALAQAAWLPVVRFLGMRPWCDHAVVVADAVHVFGADGRLVDASTQRRLRRFVEGFAAFSETRRGHAGPDIADRSRQPHLWPDAGVDGARRDRAAATFAAKEAR